MENNLEILTLERNLQLDNSKIYTVEDLLNEIKD